MAISISNRKAKFLELKPYCMFADGSSFIEVTKWSNGEGVDVTIESKNRSERFSLTHGEWQALQVVMGYEE